jgi:hypothetical protein
MRRIAGSLVMSFFLVFAVALGADAGKFHFNFTAFSSGSLTFSGVGVGLGNSEYVATMDATATVRALCENKGGAKAGGRNDIFVSLAGPQAEEIRTEDSGKTFVSLTVDNPSLVDLGASPSAKLNCPNGNWSVVDVVVVEWTSAHILIEELGTQAALFDQGYSCSGGGVVFDADGNPVENGQGGYLLNVVSCEEA